MQKDTLKPSDLPALINAYQQAYWQASSMEARNVIALQLWDLRREARLKQRLQPRGGHRAP